MAIRADADSLGDGSNILYVGDFNIRTSDEPMYQTLLSAGPGQAFDPIDSPGNWHNSLQFESLHTQSPSDGSSGLVTGGVDDRFDFQLISGELFDGVGLDYLEGSYRVFGNNGTHGLNNPINSASNTAQPVEVLNALAFASDHLPVVADYYFNLPAFASTDFDLDGDSDVHDLDLLISKRPANLLPATDETKAFDLNGTGTLDPGDIDHWLSDAAPLNGFADAYLLGDANLDGAVNARDLNALEVNWLTSDDPVWSGGDFTGNGGVSAADLGVLGINWNREVPQASTVPEPTSAFLLLLGFVFLGSLDVLADASVLTSGAIVTEVSSLPSYLSLLTQFVTIPRRFEHLVKEAGQCRSG